jgi:hypothetical protein
MIPVDGHQVEYNSTNVDNKDLRFRETFVELFEFGADLIKYFGNLLGHRSK